MERGSYGCDVVTVAQVAKVIDLVGRLLWPCFRRARAHRDAVGYLLGLIAGVERNNGWQLA